LSVYTDVIVVCVAVSRSTVRDWLILFCGLLLTDISSHVLLSISEVFVERVSRRLANLSYFIWMVCPAVLMSVSLQPVLGQCTKVPGSNHLPCYTHHYCNGLLHSVGKLERASGLVIMLNDGGWL